MIPTSTSPSNSRENPRESPRAEDVIAFAEGNWGKDCAVCSIDLLGQDAVLSLFLGFREAARCVRCLAEHHHQEVQSFLLRAVRNLARLDCYRAGWQHADRRLALAGPWPEQRIPSSLRMTMTSYMDGAEESDAHNESNEFHGADSAAQFADAHEHYDAGDQGCGELVLALKVRFARLAPGTLLHLTATDLGAREDLPAWCRMTGHRLERAEPPEYLIARRPETQGEPS